MNIFALDDNPRIAAKYHVDSHVVKMILETAQLLSTAHHVLDGESAITPFIYKKTHVNHPSAKWVRENASNYLWAYRLLLSLIDEFVYRYKKAHLTGRLVPYLSSLPKNIPHGSITPFAQAMPDEFKDSDSIIAYRKYYIHGKSHLHKWTNREKPFWMGGKSMWDTKQEPTMAL